MGLTKTQIFDQKQNELATIFKVFANPARVAILEYIASQKACICNDIVEEIGLAQPTISQHLKELKSLNIIAGEIDGKKSLLLHQYGAMGEHPGNNKSIF